MVPQLLTAVAVAMGAKEIVKAKAGKDYVVKWSNGSSATLTEAQLKTAADGLKNVVKNDDVKPVANNAARFATNVGSFLKGIGSLERLATYVKYLENNVSQTAAANTLYAKTHGTVASLAKEHATATGSKNGGRSV